MKKWISAKSYVLQKMNHAEIPHDEVGKKEYLARLSKVYAALRRFQANNFMLGNIGYIEPETDRNWKDFLRFDDQLVPFLERYMAGDRSFLEIFVPMEQALEDAINE